ncbi:hypothetical protein Tco_0623863 [Tanacetum coccineum]|uniref:Uncharacterized protein n=1 Tax=Tanacetum coccineum TaxID=301880 RepID=A0ABQ4WCD3_9ASTR
MNRLCCTNLQEIRGRWKTWDKLDLNVFVSFKDISYLDVLSMAKLSLLGHTFHFGLGGGESRLLRLHTGDSVMCLIARISAILLRVLRCECRHTYTSPLGSLRIDCAKLKQTIPRIFSSPTSSTSFRKIVFGTQLTLEADFPHPCLATLPVRLLCWDVEHFQLVDTEHFFPLILYLGISIHILFLVVEEVLTVGLLWGDLHCPILIQRLGFSCDGEVWIRFWLYLLCLLYLGSCNLR